MSDFDRLIRERDLMHRDMPRIIAIINEGIDELARAIEATLEPYKNLGVFCQRTQSNLKHAVYGQISTKSFAVTYAGPVPLQIAFHPSPKDTGPLGMFMMQRADLNMPHYVIAPVGSARYNVWKWKFYKRFQGAQFDIEEDFTEEAFKQASYDLLTV